MLLFRVKNPKVDKTWVIFPSGVLVIFSELILTISSIERVRRCDAMRYSLQLPSLFILSLTFETRDSILPSQSEILQLLHYDRSNPLSKGNNEYSSIEFIVYIGWEMLLTAAAILTPAFSVVARDLAPMDGMGRFFSSVLYERAFSARTRRYFHYHTWKDSFTLVQFAGGESWVVWVGLNFIERPIMKTESPLDWEHWM